MVAAHGGSAAIVVRGVLRGAWLLDGGAGPPALPRSPGLPLGLRAAGRGVRAGCRTCPSGSGRSWRRTGRSSRPTVATHHVAPDGTDKLLLECRDGRRIECVLMAEEDRRTVCISTQVGCGMGCVFCASGLKGVERNLTKGEIVEQVVRLRNLLPDGGAADQPGRHGDGREPGEPRQPDRRRWIGSARTQGLGMGQRRVTISTVGLPEKMRKLAAMDRSYNLAVSLHAPTEALRDELVPINAKVGLREVVDAADEYFRRSGRRVTFEYVMLRGINDGLMRGRGAGRPARGEEGPRQPDPVQPGGGPALRATLGRRRSGGSRGSSRPGGSA